MRNEDDFKFLVSKIKDLNYTLFKNPTEILYRDIIPLSWKIDLDILCCEYRVKLKINKRKEWFYSYNHTKKSITMYEYEERPLKCIIVQFCHELAHAIQYYNWYGNFHKSFNSCIQFERQASRLSYFIYKKYFSHVKKIHHREFVFYWSKSDIEYLRSQYKKQGIKVKGL